MQFVDASPMVSESHRGTFAMATELTAEEIAAAAASPSSVTVDGQTVSDRSAADKIALDQYAMKKAAAVASNPARGVRRAIMQKFILPGHT